MISPKYLLRLGGEGRRSFPSPSLNKYAGDNRFNIS